MEKAWDNWDRVQLYTSAGELIDNVRVTLSSDGRYPQAVDYNGKSYVLTGGRYVEAAASAAVKIDQP